MVQPKVSCTYTWKESVLALYVELFANVIQFAGSKRYCQVDNLFDNLVAEFHCVP